MTRSNWYDRFRRDVIVIFIVIIALSWIGNFFHWNWDDSDSVSTRSGMKVFTDAKTGCEYLGRPHGGIIQRFDKIGKQVCK